MDLESCRAIQPRFLSCWEHAMSSVRHKMGSRGSRRLSSNARIKGPFLPLQRRDPVRRSQSHWEEAELLGSISGRMAGGIEFLSRLRYLQEAGSPQRRENIIAETRRDSLMAYLAEGARGSQAFGDVTRWRGDGCGWLSNHGRVTWLVEAPSARTSFPVAHLG